LCGDNEKIMGIIMLARILKEGIVLAFFVIEKGVSYLCVV
jgi:hypothetical protein